MSFVKLLVVVVPRGLLALKKESVALTTPGQREDVVLDPVPVPLVAALAAAAAAAGDAVCIGAADKKPANR